jgi:hypothetical protein
LGPHPRAVVFCGRLAVGREDHDLVASSAQPLDEALEAVLHAAHMAEGAGLLRHTPIRALAGTALLHISLKGSAFAHNKGYSRWQSRHIVLLRYDWS